MNMLKTVESLISQVTGPVKLTYDTDFIKDLRLNSFDIINIISIFEDKFGIKIPNRDVWKLRCVRDLIDYMKTRGVS